MRFDFHDQHDPANENRIRHKISPQLKHEQWTKITITNSQYVTWFDTREIHKNKLKPLKRGGELGGAKILKHVACSDFRT